jgi:Protein phosphatase 2C
VILVGAISEGSDPINEDGYGIIGHTNNIAAAWVLDGVTGINDENFLPAGSDAQWLVNRASGHLQNIAGHNALLPQILSDIVKALIADWDEASTKLNLPVDYDPPAACLILAKHYADGWRALRLGDSCLIAQQDGEFSQRWTTSHNNAFDRLLAEEAKLRRAQRQFEMKAFLAEFRPQLLANRKTRNTPTGLGILNTDPASINAAEYLYLGNPSKILLCTDGYYRAVDHYKLYDDFSLLSNCSSQSNLEKILREIRATESDDPQCDAYLRFKRSDDATALMLASPNSSS